MLRQPRFVVAIVLVAVAASLLTSALLSYFKFGRGRVQAESNSRVLSPEMRTFWSPFLHDREGPYVVYSNAAFVGTPVTGMRYFNSARDEQSRVSHHYTGVGELMGAVRLGVLFDQFERPFRLKRGGLFTLDEALQNDLIFLGSPTENPQLTKVLTTHEFVFDNVPTDPGHRFGVVALHPHEKEPAGFPSTAAPNGDDYAIIALAQGPNPSYKVLILEGTSTLTTEAAAEFVCEQGSVSELMHKLGVIPGTSLPNFEAVIRVKITDDVPLESRLVAFRRTS